MSVRSVYGPGGHPGDQARVQDGVLTSYMDAAFVLLPHERSDKSITFFLPGRPTTAPTRLEFV